jgi:hypothetical protein
VTENDIDDLLKARYMNLSCPPASPEAKGLVEDIIDIIAKSEKRLRARKANEVPVFKSAVGLIIGDLLIGFHTRDAGWPCLSMSTSAFWVQDFQAYCGNLGGPWSHQSLFGPKLEKHQV